MPWHHTPILFPDIAKAAPHLTNIELFLLNTRMDPVGNHQEDSYPTSYGLLRFRSAPNSLLLSNTTEAPLATKDGIESGGFCPGFTNYGCGRDDNSESESRSLQIFNHKPQSMTSVTTTTAATEVGYRESPCPYTGLPPQYPRYSGNSSFAGIKGGNSGLVSSGGMNNNQMRPFAFGLTRQSSSPPGLFSDLTTSNGNEPSLHDSRYTVLNGLGSYRFERDTDGELSPSSNRLKNQNSFPSRPPSLGILPRISELGREDFRAPSLNDTKYSVAKMDDRLEGRGFLFDPWNAPTSHFPQNFMSLKKETGNGLKESFDSQNGEVGGRHVSLLSHHLSSSKSSSGMVSLQLQDSVPCKIRAKRGCATHPRSIAERERRMRISERMRKLQELVPNMDKQTNTADMLDLAVEYIKNLQKQYKILSEHRANCKCMSME